MAIQKMRDCSTFCWEEGLFTTSALSLENQSAPELLQNAAKDVSIDATRLYEASIHRHRVEPLARADHLSYTTFRLYFLQFSTYFNSIICERKPNTNSCRLELMTASGPRVDVAATSSSL